MSLWMIWLLPGTRTCNIFINGWLSIGWRTKLLLQEMVGNHPFHPLKNWLFRVPGEFRVFRQWFVLPTQVAGWFQGTRAHLRRCDQATWWFDRIDKDCFVCLFACLLVCLFVCLFLLSFPGEPQNQWYMPKSGSGYYHKLILWHLFMHSSVFLPWVQDVINVRVCSYTKMSFVHILLVFIG